MAGGFVGGKNKSKTIDIQLTTLVDVFVVLVIFLVKATVIGASDLSLPNHMQPPKSYNKETIESAPNVTVTPKEVKISALGKEHLVHAPLPLKEFSGVEANGPAVQEFKAYLKKYVDALPPEMKVQGTALNIVADRDTHYADLFDVIHVFRDAGFETMLFVAEGDGLPKSLQGIAGQEGVQLPANAAPPVNGKAGSGK